MRRFLVCVGVVLLLVPCLTQAATNSRLTGTVVDRDEMALPGVTVTLSSDILIGGAQVAITDVDGRFGFNLLPPGMYTVATDLPGFSSGEVEARVALDRSTQVRIMMVMEEFAAEIEVTAEAPVVDTAQVNSGESYGTDYLKNAGVGVGGRDYLSVIGQAAGVVGTGNVRVLGSVSSDNVYLIDGLNTTDPITATFSTNFNYDAIAEVSIQTSGFEAEFGQALGGIINLVTKSGGNEFSGTVDVRYRDESFNESGTYFDPDTNPSSLEQYSGTLGGPILRDKVWFFTSIGYTLSQRTPEGSPVTRDWTGTDWIGKVTWQASDANRVIVKVSGDPAEIPFANASRFITAEAGRQQDQGGEIYQAEINSVLTDSLLLTVQAGINRGILESYPVSQDLDTPGFYDEDNNLYFNNYQNGQFSNRDSDNYKGSLSYFVDDLVGAHEAKVGVEFRKLDFRGNNFYTGGGAFTVQCLFEDNPDVCTGRNDLDGDGWADHLLTNSLDPETARDKTQSLGDLWTFYLQDSWRPMANLTVKPGVRLDTVKYTNTDGLVIADFDSWQPRIGVAWDFLGDGKQVLRANWGQFMHPGSVNLADTVNGRSQGTLQYTGLEYLCIPALPITCDREWQATVTGEELVTVDEQGNEHYWYLTRGSGVDPFETVDTLGVGKLEAQYVETLSVAIERQLWEETSLSLEYLDKKTKELIEDVCGNNDWIWDSSVPAGDLDDPTTWTDGAGCSGYVLANVPNLRRDYEALIAKFETRYKGTHLLVSYTYSKSEGNSNAQANRSYASEGYDFFPADYYNYYGYLDDDRRNRLKVNGYWMLPLDFIVGFDAFWSSGVALDRHADCSRINAESIEGIGLDPGIAAYCQGTLASGDMFLEPRGVARGVDNYQFDLQASKAFRFGKVSLEAILSVINLFGSELATAYNEQEFNSTYDWLEVTGHQNPRRYEIGVRLEF